MRVPRGELDADAHLTFVGLRARTRSESCGMISDRGDDRRDCSADDGRPMLQRQVDEPPVALVHRRRASAR